MSNQDNYARNWQELFDQFQTEAFDAVADLVDQIEVFAGIVNDPQSFKEHEFLSGVSFDSSIEGKWTENGLAYLVNIRSPETEEGAGSSSIMLVPLDRTRVQILAVRHCGDEEDRRELLEYDLSKATERDYLDVYKDFHKMLVWALPLSDREKFCHAFDYGTLYDLSNEIVLAKFASHSGEDSIRAYFTSMTNPRNKTEGSKKHQEGLNRWHSHEIARELRAATI